jgi:hypothetical protein
MELNCIPGIFHPKSEEGLQFVYDGADGGDDANSTNH